MRKQKFVGGHWICKNTQDVRWEPRTNYRALHLSHYVGLITRSKSHVMLQNNPQGEMECTAKTRRARAGNRLRDGCTALFTLLLHIFEIFHNKLL